MIAPRGDILDRDGNVLVDNRTSLALQLNTAETARRPGRRTGRADAAGRARAHVAAQGAADDRRTGRSRRRGAGDAAPATSATTSSTTSKRTSAEFPGVTRAAGLRPPLPRRHPRRPRGRQRRRGLRRRAEGSRATRASNPATRSARAGVEYTYDKYLRGEPGLTRIQVNALGQPTPGGQLVSTPPTPGDNLKLTIDPEVQAAGESGARRARAARRLHHDEHRQRPDPRRWAPIPTYDPTDLHRTDDPGAGQRTVSATRCWRR